MSEIVCNENVTCQILWQNYAGTRYSFVPTDGYALWRDNETGNLDENGEPMCYWYTIDCWDDTVAEYAPHIWAKLIDETMEVFGNTEQPVMKVRMMTMGLSDEEVEEPSSTYIDENGVERDKRGVY